MTDKDKLDYLEYIKDFMDEAAKAYIRDDDAYIGALNSADALLTGLLNDDDEEDEE